MICTYVAEKLQQYRASRSFSTQVCVDTFRMLISFKAVYLRQDDILFCSWTSCNACCLHPWKGLHSVYGVIGFLFGFVIVAMWCKEWLNQDLLIAMWLAINGLWHDSRLGFSERWWSQPLRLRLFQGWLCSHHGTWSWEGGHVSQLNQWNQLQQAKFRFQMQFIMSVMDTWPRLVVMVL